ncbi:MAG: PPC domain-containing protein [Pirellula sp.]|jgi:hypothetical protein|nr:PPC domain-containing protein [Pirellula sp.]
MNMIRFAIIPAIGLTLLITWLIPYRGIANEPPQISRIEPNSLATGQLAEVRVVGPFKSWPVQIWSSSPDVSWSCQKEPGVFQVAVNNATPLKETWLRLFHASGTSPAKRLLIASQPALIENEPNDRFTKANDIEAESIVSAALEKNVDVDCFRVSLNEGDLFSAVVDSHRYGSPADANLQLLDEKGFVLKESIDHFGLDPALSFAITRSGIYYVRVFAFPAEPDSTISFRGGADWWYRLRCMKGPLPLEIPPARDATLAQCTQQDAKPGLNPESAPNLNLQEKVFQTIESSDDHSGKPTSQKHYFKLPKAPGTQIQIEITAQSMGSNLDPTLAILDSNGKQLAYQDDAGNDRDISLVWSIPDDKDYYAVLADFHRRGGKQNSYWLALTQVQPYVIVASTSDAYTTKINEEIEIGLKLEKPAEWSGDLELINTDPSLEIVFASNPIKIEKGTKDASVKLKVTKAYAGVLPIEWKQKESNTALPLSGPHSKNVPSWLTVVE